MQGKEELDLISEIYRELREEAVKFADDAINFAKEIAKNARNFKYFCAALLIYSVVFAALGLYFIQLPENFITSLSLLTLCWINILYALLLWRDYAKTVEKYRYLVDAEKEMEIIKQKVREMETHGTCSERTT